MKESWESMEAKRRKAEAELRKSGGDVSIPSIETLQAEADEVAPRNYLDILDDDGTVMARLDLSNDAGIHSVVWDMRLDGLLRRGGGPLVAPGKYSAQAYRSEDGEATTVGESVELELVSIDEPTIPMPDRQETLEQIREMSLVASRSQSLRRDLRDELTTVRELIDRIENHPRGSADLLQRARELRRRMEGYNRQLTGDPIKDERWIRQRPGINQRISRSLYIATSGTHGPTASAIEQYEIGKTQFEAIEPKIKALLDEDLPSLQEAIAEVNIPVEAVEVDSGQEED